MTKTDVGESRAVGTGLALAVALVLAASGCQQPTGNATTSGKAAPAAKPAKLEGTPKEADLATVTLTAEAETRLGLATGAVEKKAVPKAAIYAGEVTVPPGGLIAVTSPFVGSVKAAPGSAGLPLPGAAVKEGQPFCVLLPVLTPEARATMAPLRIEAEGLVLQAKEQVNIAKVVLNRAENLVRDKLGGAAALVDAKAQYDLATTTLKAAEARRTTIEKVATDAESGAVSVQTVTSPASGIVRNVHARPGQVVAAGAALFEVETLDPVWVKVPVYVGDVPRLAHDRPAEIGGLTEAPGAPGSRPGKPVAAPPSGNPLAATVDLYYEVANPDGALRPGERVGATLPLKGESTSLTVPRAALIRDIHGGAWVYEKIADHKYARRRVQVDRVAGPVAVLASGPKPGASVVTDGAAELYGAEFGGGK